MRIDYSIDSLHSLSREPELSVIITSFNQTSFLLEAVDSFEKFSKNCNCELIIIDDGSTIKETRRIIDNLKTRGFKVIIQANQGLPSARNNAIDAARGEILLFLDDDNRLLEPYFTIGMDIMNSNTCIDVVYGDRLEFGISSRIVEIGCIVPSDLWLMNRIDNCALIRKSYLDRCGGYDERLSGLGFEDWDLWLNGLIQKEGLTLGYINLPCFEYRVRENSMLQRLFESKELQSRLMRILNSKYSPLIGNGGFE